MTHFLSSSKLSIFLDSGKIKSTPKDKLKDSSDLKNLLNEYIFILEHGTNRSDRKIPSLGISKIRTVTNQGPIGIDLLDSISVSNSYGHQPISFLNSGTSQRNPS